MAKVFDFKRMRTFIKIYAVVQVVLVGLLVFAAVHFQTGLQAQGRPQRFLHSVVVTLVIQLALFYPISKFAAKEAEREIESSVVGLTPEELKALRSKRMLADAIKWSHIVHLQNASPDVAALAKFFGKPIVLTIHNYMRRERNLPRSWGMMQKLQGWSQPSAILI